LQNIAILCKEMHQKLQKNAIICYILLGFVLKISQKNAFYDQMTNSLRPTVGLQKKANKCKKS
jgi:hypothetical protein